MISEQRANFHQPVLARFLECFFLDNLPYSFDLGVSRNLSKKNCVQDDVTFKFCVNILST